MTRYLSSAFFGHTTVEDLKLKFEEATQNVDTKRMVQVSMDGPNISWEMVRKITEKRSSTEHYPGLINVGSCSLHVVLCAFRSCESNTKWGIDTLLKALHKLFDKSPAKREDYTKITASDIWYLLTTILWPQMAWRQKCCWKGIADLASNHHLHQWDLEEAKESNSYIKNIFYSEVCCPGQLDNCKVGLFLSVVDILKPYLEIFQSDAPLLLLSETPFGQVWYYFGSGWHLLRSSGQGDLWSDIPLQVRLGVRLTIGQMYPPG